jgi:hypothetical protein
MTTTTTTTETPTVVRNSPWGKAQTVKAIADGIWFVTTPSHGGFYVAPHLRADIAPDLQRYAAAWCHGFGPGWFEEDCAAAIVPVSFPHHFAPAHVTKAAEVVAWIRKERIANNVF